MADQKLARAFEFIDVNNTGIILKKDIQNYMVSHDFTDREIKDYGNRFEINDTTKFNEISEKEFFTILGYETVPKRQTEHLEGVKVLSENMLKAHQFECEQIVREALDSDKNNKEVAREIKANLDKRIERLWHVVIIRGQYWAFYSHEPNYSYVFSYNNHIFIMWRTPGY